MYPHWRKPPEEEAEWLEAVMNLARHLRSPDGCPWDREQTAGDFARFAGEELEELREALASGDNGHVAEEAGDVLFCLFAMIAAAETEGRFELTGCLKSIHEKMIRRHGHVFGGEAAETPEDAVAVWNAIKAREKGRGGEDAGADQSGG